MPVNLHPVESLLPVPGVRLGVGRGGIKHQHRDDVLLLELAPGSAVAGSFTRNAFCAAPVQCCRAALSSEQPIAGLLINSGNANAGTGAAGLRVAQQSMAAAAQALGRPEASVLPFSTGVIGQALPLEKLSKGLEQAQQQLAEDNWLPAARAIMTTDTVPKGASRQLQTAAGRVTVTGIAKGAGMICPDMATMLAFVACDAHIADGDLQGLLDQAVAESFNSITVDGDTSTNDAAVLCATGRVGEQALSPDSADFAALGRAVREVCLELAQAIVRDAEGATRFVEIQVDGGRDVAECRQVAYCIAHSPLVKTALFAGDANWGRILAAVGRSGLGELDLSRISLGIDDLELICDGEPSAGYQEADGAAAFARAENRIWVRLGRGSAEARIWTCDLGYDYVRINAEYRT